MKRKMVTLLTIAVSATMLLGGCGTNSDISESNEALATDNTEVEQSQEISTNDESRHLVVSENAKYSFNGLTTLDLSMRNYTPGQKQQGMEWDSTLFYTLEDVYADSAEDNQIVNYQIVNFEFLNAKTQNVIRCVVYKAPDTGRIDKIVTIENQNGAYLVSDYYYNNGKVNFVFTRTVDVYTPTYATIDKVGTRYYFNNDVLVRYRRIDVPKQIEQQTLNPSTTWYPNHSYFELPNQERATYDAVEFQVLNEAYNVWNAVQEKDTLFEMKGFVYENDDTPISNASIAVIASADDTVLYTTNTAGDGSYHIYTLLDGTDCYLQIYAEGYRPAYIYNVQLDESLADNGFSCLYLAKEGTGEEEVHFYLYNAVELTVGSDNALLSDGQVIIRSGWNVKSGESVVEGTLESPNYSTQLKQGIYTVEFRANGYTTTYENFCVTGDGCEVRGYTVPTITDDSQKAVLCWDSDIDLDMVLYTPEKSAYGDMNYISVRQPMDDYQDFLIADGTDTRCEVMNIGNQLAGIYKLYVNDYTGFSNGNYDSNALAISKARVYIYSQNGLIAVYRVDSSQSGIVWNVCERGNGGYHPDSIVSSNVNGYMALDKTQPTKDELLEMYKEFLRGNITAEYEGSQIDYDRLKDIYKLDCGAEVESESFALMDIDMDNKPELQINFWSFYANNLYSMKIVNNNLTINQSLAEGYSDSIILYKNGIYCIAHGLSLDWIEQFTDTENNGLAYFRYTPVEGDVDGEYYAEWARNTYDDLSPDYKYVCIFYGNDEVADRYNEVLDEFITDYCGEEVPFYDVNEASLQENMKWD